MKEGWKYVKIKDVGLTQTGTTPSKSIKENYGDYMPFIRPAELNIDGNGLIRYDSEVKLSKQGVSAGRLFPTGSILMCCIGSVGKTGYATQPVSCNQQINVLVPNKDNDTRYLYYALISPSFQKAVISEAESAKATVAIINKRKWEQIQIPLPPLSEQQRIVEELDSTFAKIDALKANAEKIAEEAKALFAASLREIMTPQEGWEEKKLTEICETITDFVAAGSFASLRENVVYEDQPSHAQLVRTMDLKSNFSKGSMVYVNESAFNFLYRVNLNEECVVLPNVGVNCGEVYFVDPEKLPYKNNVLGPNAIMVRSTTNNNCFLSYLFQAEDFQRKLSGITSHMAQPKFNKTGLRAITTDLPPLPEQTRIVSTLDTLSAQVRQLEANFKKVSEECDALKQAILRETFE